MFALGIRYLTGYAVATDVSDYQHAEWPPHPARVFMAMAAAYFETGNNPDEKAALQWLETLPPPSLYASDISRRDVNTQYVPVNDKAGPAKHSIQSVPTLTRLRTARYFPCVAPENDTVLLIWNSANPDPNTRSAIEHICQNVIRIGHSSSLVQMWVEDHPQPENWIPADSKFESDIQMRIFSNGFLDYLSSQFYTAAMREYDDIEQQINTVIGKTKKEQNAKKKKLKSILKDKFGNKRPNKPIRPQIGLWQGYKHIEGKEYIQNIASGHFDRDLMILTLQNGPAIGLESTWQLTNALRNTILKHCDPTPEWINGHQPCGKASQSPHLAIVPLAFVGFEHADGHLLGLGLAFPNNITPKQRSKTLQNLFYDQNGQRKTIRLKLGQLGDWELTRENRPSPPKALQVQTWTAPSKYWATVTPFVLDRHPKADYRKNQAAWRLEVAQSIATACQLQGLPEPIAVDIEKTCWHRGAPRAIPGKTGYPFMPTTSGKSTRPQVHAWLEFDVPVQGPLILCAGRYRGYGLCKPWKGTRI